MGDVITILSGAAPKLPEAMIANAIAGEILLQFLKHERIKVVYFCSAGKTTIGLWPASAYSSTGQKFRVLVSGH